MNAKSTLNERCNKILEDNGGTVADRARRILLEDAPVMELRPPLEFISKTWRDPLTPSMITLSCKAVGDQPDVAYDVALAMSLMHLSFHIWDDIMDKATQKLLKPTLFGKFGEGTALMIGGLASARAFSILNQMDIDTTKRHTITKLIWNLYVKMAQAETVNLRLRRQSTASPRKKLEIVTAEAADLETCMRIGALLGNGSADTVNHLARYGRYLGVILELRKDFLVSMNLTLTLAERMRIGALPYSLRWAMQRSEKIQELLAASANLNTIKPSDIKVLIEHTLETKVFNHTVKTIRGFTAKAVQHLGQLTPNHTISTLKFFVEAQPKLFIESLAAGHD